MDLSIFDSPDHVDQDKENQKQNSPLIHEIRKATVNLPQMISSRGFARDHFFTGFNHSDSADFERVENNLPLDPSLQNPAQQNATSDPILKNPNNQTTISIGQIESSADIHRDMSISEQDGFFFKTSLLTSVRNNLYEEQFMKYFTESRTCLLKCGTDSNSMKTSSPTDNNDDDDTPFEDDIDDFNLEDNITHMSYHELSKRMDLVSWSIKVPNPHPIFAPNEAMALQWPNVAYICCWGTQCFDVRQDQYRAPLPELSKFNQAAYSMKYNNVESMLLTVRLTGKSVESFTKLTHELA